jgi:hypothetical protein
VRRASRAGGECGGGEHRGASGAARGAHQLLELEPGCGGLRGVQLRRLQVVLGHHHGDQAAFLVERARERARESKRVGSGHAACCWLLPCCAAPSSSSTHRRCAVRQLARALVGAGAGGARDARWRRARMGGHAGAGGHGGEGRAWWGRGGEASCQARGGWSGGRAGVEAEEALLRTGWIETSTPRTAARLAATL